MTESDADRASTVLTRRGIPFREIDDRTLELDVYRPRDAADSEGDRPPNADAGAETNANRPIVVFVHGGGWIDGTTGQFARYALAFAAAGWVAVECGYRFADEARFPAQIADVHAALDWLGEHGAAYGGDPDRLAVVGYSAGAHLAVLTSLTREHPDLSPDSSSRPAERPSIGAVAGISGIYDFDYSTDAREDFADPLANPDADRSIEAQRRLASPVSHVSRAESPPPTLLLHGDADDTVSIAQSKRYRALLEDAGATAELATVPGGDHAFLHRYGEYPSTRDRVLSFFEATV